MLLEAADLAVEADDRLQRASTERAQNRPKPITIRRGASSSGSPAMPSSTVTTKKAMLKRSARSQRHR